MENLVEKVIKLCNRICEGNYPINSLGVFTNSESGFSINSISVYINSGILEILTQKGLIRTDINKVDQAKLFIAIQKVKDYSKQLAEDVLDEYINVEDTKISNVNELDCDN